MKNLIVFGTRPEAIKMAPLINLFLKEKSFETKICVTAQHRQMLDQVLNFFDITPDYDLNLMATNQTLQNLTTTIIKKIQPVFEKFQPQYIYVHGDTTTTMATSLAAFYANIKICHIEAGLRTYNLQSPFPEEMNRTITGVLTTYHFAPTIAAKKNLVKENKKEKNIIVTGNTVIDALYLGIKKIKSPGYKNKEIDNLKQKIDPNKKIILVTGHRRENHGKGFLNICKALKKIAHKNNTIQILYPVHLNPNVQKPVYDILGNKKNILLIAPLSYPAFLWAMQNCHLIITDSGGIQEEAPSLGKPVLVMRNITERQESIKAGTSILVGTDVETIVSTTQLLLNNKKYYEKMSTLHNPYGKGNACKTILNFIKKNG